ncbi:MAG: OmpA family protein [Saprospiraceae bacterium]|nr:OmpA family protein [Saprospiraceae bacterium]
MNASKHISALFALFFVSSFLIAQTQPLAVEPVTVDVKNEEAINTAGLEFSPTFYEDGIVLISTNTAGLKKETDPRLKLPAMSILRSRRSPDGALLPPEPFAKELSTLYNDGPVCFDRTAETVFFSRNNVSKGKPKLAKDKTQKQRLYYSKKENGVWSEPQPLSFGNDQWDDVHPAISIDGDKLFFSSNRPGGSGGMDLYVSYRVGDLWSEPVNLGSTINTAGNEAFPFVHADNTLYFASTGHEGGAGGFDLYYSIPEGANTWTKPVNLGAPFNSKGDDLGLIVDLNKINGYFASNGNGGKGSDDLFSFHTENGNLDDYLLQNQRVPDRNLDLVVSATEKLSGTPIVAANVSILNLETNNAIGRDENGNLITIQNVNGQDVMKATQPDKGVTGMTDSKGQFTTELKPGNYAVTVSKDGFQPKQFRMTISKPGNQLQAALEKVNMSGKVHWNATAFNYVTNAPLAGATLVLTDKRTGARDTVVADANGMVDYYLNEKSQYKVDFYQGGRMIGSADVDTNDWNLPNQIMLQNFSVAPLLPGTVIDLPSVYYNFNDATLRPDARKDLGMVIALMKQQPTITVEIASHTDCRGNSGYNQELSQRRANGVVEYLISQGIPRDRLRPVGYGESEPRNRCTDGVPCTDQEHARNRRTELRILTGVQGASVVYVDGEVAGSNVNNGKTEVKPNVNTAPATPNGAVAIRNGAKSAYYVVAGSFASEANAQKRQAELLQLGYSDAQVVQFPGSPYYSVSVKKLDTQKDALSLKKQLDSKDKIDSFIRPMPAGNN